jgi:hypothetical protein
VYSCYRVFSERECVCLGLNVEGDFRERVVVRCIAVRGALLTESVGDVYSSYRVSSDRV